MNITFTPKAERNLRAIYNHIAKNNERAAGHVIARIRQTVMIFERFPLLGHTGRVEATREFAIPGLPYTIVCAIVSEIVLDILTILHQRLKYPLASDGTGE